MNHFERFGLPASYELELKALESKFRDLSLKFHPDRLATKDPKERRVAVEQTAQLNEGFRILKDPVRRAVYLLKLRGVDLERDEASAKPALPMDFLEEVMSLREELDEARAAKDFDKARAMGKDVEARRAASLMTAIAALSVNEPEATARATEQLIQVRYFTRFLEEVESITEENA